MARPARALNPVSPTPRVLKPTDRASAATAIAVILAALPLKLLTTSWSYFWLTTALTVLLLGISLVVRRLRFGGGMVLLVQVVGFAAFLFAMAQALRTEGNALSGWWGLYVQAREHILDQAPPMAPHPGITLLFVSIMGLIAILTDVMVQSIHRPGWSILPLAMVWAVPTFGLRTDIPFWPVAALFAGYLLILMSEGINATAWWPRGVRRRDTDRGGSGLAIRSALLIGVPALALAMVGGMLLPVLINDEWTRGKPKGADGPITISDPALDLRRNLNQPEDRDVITYTSTNPDGEYLRLTALPVFDATGWHTSGVQLYDLPPDPAPGVSGVDYKTVETQVQVSEFESEYLPLPYAPQQVQVDGEWKQERDSLTVIATGSDRKTATAGLTYSVSSLDVAPDGTGLSSAKTGNPPDARYTVPLPQDLPQNLFDLSQEITSGQPTPALKAAAIQSYLRSDEFTYSTEPSAGTGYDALEQFLFHDKTGYCEQFAGSMAVLARLAGIPSRVAIGFLPGEEKGNQRVVSIHDYHAWPELYFEGYGWVRFEPTPSVGVAPAWTIVGSNSEGQSEQPGEEGTPSPTPEDEGSPSPTPSEPETPQPPQPSTDDGETPGWLQGLIFAGIVVGVAAVVALLVSIPFLIRRSRRSRRLATTGELAERVEGAWAEVRDSVVDSGGEWPKGSPRVIGKLVGERLDTQSARAMEVLALNVERQRYARRNSVNADLAAMAHDIRRGLVKDQDLSTRIAFNWWPRSLWKRGH